MNTNRLTLGAILTGAFAASLCCLGPLLLALLGVGSASLFQHLAAFRPYLLVLTVAAIGYGFYLAYRPAKACADGTVCDTRPGIKRLGRITIWLVALISFVLMGFPYYSSHLLAGALQSSTPTAAASQSATTVLKVTGMTCGGCAMKVKTALLAMPGVISAEVSSDKGEAVVRHDPRLKPESMIAAIKAAGYGASL